MKTSLVTLAAATVGVAQAGIVIDDFDNPLLGQGIVISKPTGAVGPQYVGEPVSGVIGGYRTVYLGTTTGQGRSQISALANVTPDFFTLITDSATIAGYAGIIWDGGTPAGLNYDFSSYNYFRWDYDNDQQTVYSLTFESYGGGAHTISVIRPGGTTGSQVLPLSAYANAGVNLADVDRISIRIDTAAGGDVSVHFIGADIPEPASTGVAIGGLALLGVAAFRRAARA